MLCRVERIVGGTEQLRNIIAASTFDQPDADGKCNRLFGASGHTHVADGFTQRLGEVSAFPFYARIEHKGEFFTSETSRHIVGPDMFADRVGQRLLQDGHRCR